MSKNVLALLIACALILASALEITYMTTKSPIPTTQSIGSLDQSMNKRARPRASVFINGLPTQVAPGSLSERLAQPQPPKTPETNYAVTGTLIDGSVRADARVLGENQ